MFIYKELVDMIYALSEAASFEKLRNSFDLGGCVKYPERRRNNSVR